MDFDFEHRGEVTRFTLDDGAFSLGGADGDHVRLEGLPPALLHLRVARGQLRVESTHPVTVGGALLPPGVERLVLAGEPLQLPDGMRLCARPRREAAGGPCGTATLLRGLLASGEEPPSRAATLTCLTGPELGRTVALAQAHTEVGRGPEATVRFRDPAMSRVHARLRRDASAYTVEDLGGPNGVYLNGRKVDGEAALVDGDVLELGLTLLRFESPPGTVSGASQADTPTGGPSPDAPDTPAWRSRRPAGAWLVGLGVLLALAALLLLGEALGS